MNDDQIIQLYFDRSEQAIKETDAKYGGYCYSIAYNILTNSEDAEESVSDTYLSAWNAMPPRRPSILATFLGKITHRLAIDRWRYRNACKSGRRRGDAGIGRAGGLRFPGQSGKGHGSQGACRGLQQLSGIPAGNGTAGIPEPVLVLQLRKSPLPVYWGQRGFVNLQVPLADCGKRMFLRIRL